MKATTRRSFLAVLAGAGLYKEQPLKPQAPEEELVEMVVAVEATYTYGLYPPRCFHCDSPMIVPNGMKEADKVAMCDNKMCKKAGAAFKVMPYVPMVEL
jgi:hypothetical protein